MTPGLSGIYQDVSFAIRMLAKDRRFTIASVAALALAIGANSSVFKLVNAALIRDLPFDRADRLVSIGWTNGRGLGAISYPDFLEWRETSTTLEGLGAQVNTVVNVSEPDRIPERFRGAYVSANMFRVLRTTPLLGRDFLPEDEHPGAPAVVLLGHGVWQYRYGSDSSVIGRVVRVNDVPSTIVGVMPEGFRYPFNNEMWLPLTVAPFTRTTRREDRSVYALGRMTDDANLARVRAELETLASRHRREFAADTPQRITALTMREDYRVWSPMFITFMGAVVVVLLIACANLANLLLARATGRAREMAIRASLGATRWRIVRQLLIECLFIAAVAGILGGLLSIYGANTMATAFDPLEAGARPGSTRPFWVNLSMDTMTYLYIGLLCVFAALACGLIPALLASRPGINDMLKDGGRGAAGGTRTRWWSSAFIVAEIALTLVLLSSAGLLWRSFVERYRRDVVIDTSNLLVAQVGLPVQKYPTLDARQRFFTQLDERLANLPFAAAIANVPPFGFGAPSRELSIDGIAVGEGQRPRVFVVHTGERYFEIVKLPIVRGRGLSTGDGLAGQEGAIVDEYFAAKFFPDGDAVGRRIRLTPPANRNAVGPSTTPPPAPWLTIVGVTSSLPQFGPPESVQPLVYVPRAAMPLQGLATLVVRSGRDIAGATRLLREEVRRLDPDLPLHAVEMVDDALARSRMPVRLVGTWFSIIAVIALVLASVGLYALTAHGVVQRTQEIGVRVALGAQTTQVVWLFMRRAITQLAIGLALGVAGALATGQLLQGYLDRVSPRDPLTLAIVAVFLVIVAIAASVVPARRAARVDPVVALRCE